MSSTSSEHPCKPDNALRTERPLFPSKEESDAAKNLIDLYKVCSEEVRHSATTFWQYAMAILGFQAAAIGLAVTRTSIQSLLAVMLSALVSVGLSAMLIRQAHDRSLFLSRLRLVEDQLRVFYPTTIYSFEKGPFSGFKSSDLAWLILASSMLVLIGGFGGIAIKLICGANQ